MSDKVTASHLSRTAVIYVRQSTLAQVEHNTESTARQYDLAARARQLGWLAGAVRVVDGDPGITGSVTGQRDAFEWNVPALSGLLPPFPPPRGSDCPQLQRPAATGRRRRSLTSTRTNSASRRNTKLTCTRGRVAGGCTSIL
jgi:hypothetical protein